jgi:hypothetical protein
MLRLPPDYKRIILQPTQWAGSYRNLLIPDAVIGHYCYTGIKDGVKILRADEVYTLNDNPTPLATGEVAKLSVLKMLLDTDFRKDRIPFRKGHLEYNTWIPPLVIRSGCWGLPVTQVDITACFWSLYQFLPYDIIFEPMGFVGVTDRYLRLPESDKEVRNLITGLCRATRSLWWIGSDKLVYMQALNKLLAPSWWGAMMFFLHSLTYECYTKCRVYATVTDSFYVQSEDLLKLTAIIEAWGLRWKIKESGYGYISAPHKRRIEPTWKPHPKPDKFIETDNLMIDDDSLRWAKDKWEYLRRFKDKTIHHIEYDRIKKIIIPTVGGDENLTQGGGR